MAGFPGEAGSDSSPPPRVFLLHLFQNRISDDYWYEFFLLGLYRTATFKYSAKYE